ncbi:MAG TPA: hypothetical protein ENH82_03255 [bacterium]|nr:hypothetical protein [bacterium]
MPRKKQKIETKVNPNEISLKRIKLKSTKLGEKTDKDKREEDKPIRNNSSTEKDEKHDAWIADLISPSHSEYCREWKKRNNACHDSHCVCSTQ